MDSDRQRKPIQWLVRLWVTLVSVPLWLGVHGCLDAKITDGIVSDDANVRLPEGVQVFVVSKDVAPPPEGEAREALFIVSPAESEGERASNRLPVTLARVRRQANDAKIESSLKDSVREQIVDVVEADVDDDGQPEIVGITTGGRLMAWRREAQTGEFRRYDDQVLHSRVKGQVCGFVVGRFNRHAGIDFAISVTGTRDDGLEGRFILFALSDRRQGRRFYESRLIEAPTGLFPDRDGAGELCMDLATVPNPDIAGRDQVVTMDGRRYWVPEAVSERGAASGTAFSTSAYRDYLGPSVDRGALTVFDPRLLGVPHSGLMIAGLFWSSEVGSGGEAEASSMFFLRGYDDEGRGPLFTLPILSTVGEAEPRTLTIGGPFGHGRGRIWLGRADGEMLAYALKSRLVEAVSGRREWWISRELQLPAPDLLDGSGPLSTAVFADLDGNGYDDLARAFVDAEKLNVVFFDPDNCSGARC